MEENPGMTGRSPPVVDGAGTPRPGRPAWLRLGTLVRRLTARVVDFSRELDRGWEVMYGPRRSNRPRRNHQGRGAGGPDTVITIAMSARARDSASKAALN